ncbi:MAG: YIP1 family protein [Melioribacteraceae bacterium]|nr:YIP1 family protein [Melioribacteraceae bacterium]
MEELNNDELKNDSSEFDEEELEIAHTDKLVGVFTEPSATFSDMAKTPAKAIDWLLPIIGIIVFTILSQYLLMSNPQIKYETIEKQMTKMEEAYKGMVDGGTMTQEQADQALEAARTQMENMSGGGIQVVLSGVGILFVTFILFFVLAGVYFLLVKFVLSGDGTYASAMVAYGLPYYVLILQVIVIVILSLSMNRMFTGVDVASFLDMDKSTFVGFLVSRLDIFSIWFYALISIGFAKMFKSESTVKYFILIFGLWLGFGIVFHFITKAVPFLGMFVQ